VNRKIRGLLVGAASGALLGAVLAWALLSREEVEAGDDPDRSQGLKAGTGEWLRLGVSILQAGRQMADMVRLP
jgi:hypothetical protein